MESPLRFSLKQSVLTAVIFQASPYIIFLKLYCLRLWNGRAQRFPFGSVFHTSSDFTLLSDLLNLQRLLKELKTRSRVKTTHQELLLGLHLRAPDRFREVMHGNEGDALSCLVDAVNDHLLKFLKSYKSVQERGNIPVPQLRLWCKEIVVSRSNEIFNLEESHLGIFLKSAAESGEHAVLSLAFDVAEYLCLLPDDLLERAVEDRFLLYLEEQDILLFSIDRLLTSITRRAEDARECLAISYLGYVLRMACKYIGRGVSYLDLVQEGATGLLEAIKRFDPRHNQFKQRATVWIWQRINSALAEYGRTIRLPQQVFKSVYAAEQTCDALCRAGIVEPAAPDLLLQEDDLSADDRALLATWWIGHDMLPQSILTKQHQRLAKYDQLLIYLVPPCSLDKPVDGIATSDPRRSTEDDPLPTRLKEVLVDDDVASNPDASLIEESLHIDIELSLSMLHPREAEITRLYFGIGREHPSTLEEIGQRFDLTRERVRQIKNKSLQKLKQSRLCEELKDYVAGRNKLSTLVAIDPFWRQRRMETAKSKLRVLQDLLSENLDGFRGFRRDKSAFRWYLIATFNCAQQPLSVASLMSAVNERLSMREIDQGGYLDENYIRNLLRETSKTFIALSTDVYGLVRWERERKHQEQLPFCPPLSDFLGDGLLKEIIAHGRPRQLKLSEEKIGSAERQWAASILYLLGLAQYTFCYDNPCITLTLQPPATYGEDTWLSCLSSFTQRLTAMQDFWVVLSNHAPAKTCELQSHFAKLYSLGAFDTNHRLLVLETLGAVQRDSANRYWLTERGGAFIASCGIEIPNAGDVSLNGHTSGTDAADNHGLSDEQKAWLIDSLLGLQDGL